MITELSDQQLIKSIKKGCQLSFEELIGRYSTKAYHLALRLTRNPEDAEEVLHDAFVAVHRKVKAFEGKSQFSSWFYRVTVNAALMKIRRRKNKQHFLLDDLPNPERERWRTQYEPSESPDFLTLRGELGAVLEEAIAALPTDYRIVFVLRDVDGLSNREVGSMLKITTPAVKSRLHRARLMLKHHLQGFYISFRSENEIAIKDEV